MREPTVRQCRDCGDVVMDLFFCSGKKRFRVLANTIRVPLVDNEDLPSFGQGTDFGYDEFGKLHIGKFTPKNLIKDGQKYYMVYRPHNCPAARARAQRSMRRAYVDA